MDFCRGHPCQHLFKGIYPLLSVSPAKSPPYKPLLLLTKLSPPSTPNANMVPTLKKNYKNPSPSKPPSRLYPAIPCQSTPFQTSLHPCHLPCHPQSSNTISFSSPTVEQSNTISCLCCSSFVLVYTAFLRLLPRACPVAIVLQLQP